MEPIIPENHIPPAPPEPIVPPVADPSVPPSSTAIPTPPVVEEAPHRSHTYQDDLSQAMDATDATVVQELLQTAREKEAFAADETVKNRERTMYKIGATICVVLAFLGLGYGVWHYTRLTVPVEQTVSVGVFPNTDLVVAENTNVSDVAKTFTTGALPLLEQKPTLISLVHNTTPPTLLTNTELFAFIGAKPSEPFATSINMIRWGMVNTGDATVPFIVASVPDTEKATKEFLIAEPDMLTMFYKALAIDTSVLLPDAELHFTSSYLYNLPVRILNNISLNSGPKPIMLYGYATDHIVVITTSPEALKIVYDTVIKQR